MTIIYKEIFATHPDGIHCRYLIKERPEPDRVDAVVVEISGEYPDGSRGNAHGHFIALATLNAFHAFSPDAIVLDLRGLTYRWGNSLLGVFQKLAEVEPLDEGDPGMPVTVVTSEKCRDAFLSLMTPVGSTAPEWHYSDLDAAVEGAIRLARKRMELF